MCPTTLNMSDSTESLSRCVASASDFVATPLLRMFSASLAQREAGEVLLIVQILILARLRLACYLDVRLWENEMYRRHCRSRNTALVFVRHLRRRSHHRG